MGKKLISIHSFGRLLFFLLLPIEVIGQNLVLNPGFESLKQTFEGRVNDFPTHIRYWSPPTATSTDLIATDEAGIKSFEGIKAHGGRVMAGIFTFVPQDTAGGWKPTYREYLQGTLMQPLVPGREYDLSFWIAAPGDQPALSNNIGVFFHTQRISTLHQKPLRANPQFNLALAPDFLPGQWHLISGRFLATDTCRYFVIGNFFPNDQTRLTKAGAPIDNAQCYYFIDDVSVGEVRENVALSSSISVPQKIGAAGGLVWDKVLFELNSSELNQESLPQLDEIINYLKQNPDIAISIEGHTDDMGNESYNIELSKRRARTVYAYLISQNISKDRLRFAGYGRL